MTVTGDTPAALALPVSRGRRGIVWAVTIAVTAWAAWLTAHGLHEVAVASRVPSGRAWGYPVVTDGLALVAYAATRCLSPGQRRYAWVLVILAAVLSGVAQASYLALTVTTAPAWLRAGIGAWPATAAILTAHLVYLLAPRGTATVTPAVPVTPAVSLPAPPVTPPPRPVSPPAVTPAADSDRDTRAARLRAEGVTYPDIARKLGVSQRTAMRAVKRGTPSPGGPAVPIPGGSSASTPSGPLDPRGGPEGSTRALTAVND